MDAAEQVNKFENFFEQHAYENLAQQAVEGKEFVNVDFAVLSAFDPDLANELIEDPENAIKAAEIAVERFDIEGAKEFRVRFKNLPLSQIVSIRHIRSKHIGKLIEINGIVRQKTDVRPKVTSARFECPACGNVITVLQLDTKFKEPSGCSCGRKGKFRLMGKELVDAQKITLEEAPENLDGGEQPKRMGIFLQQDLVSPISDKRTNPGSKIKIVGVTKEIPIVLAQGGKSTQFDLMIEANYVEPIQEDFTDLKISDEEIKEILELSKDPKCVDKIVRSIAPTIYGHDKIKESLFLQMLGGVQKIRPDGMITRGDIHILLIGDPGAGKSQMLKRVTRIAPKARFVAGKGASGAGLTASVVKDDFLRGWALEAGALVLANKGIACIDEMDKMTKDDTSAMHEALEQQCMLPDFKLTFADGTSKKIGRFVDQLIEKNKKNVIQGKDCEILEVKNVELLSTDFNSSFPLEAARVSRHIAPEKFIEIELTNGKKITVTPEHPCWVVNDGKITTLPAEKMNEKMFFPIPSKMSIKSCKYEKKNDHLCKILGYHISDGCYELNRGKKNGIQFWNNDERLINDYKNSIKQFFKKTPGISKRNHQFAVRVVSKKVVEHLMKLDECLLEKGPIKKIPEKVMNFPNQNIKYLLRALFDGDGTVVFQKRGGCRVSLSTENRELAEQVSDLLLRFDIQSSIFRDKKGHVWLVDISGQENLMNFLAQISFLSIKKKERLRKYCEKNKTYRTIKDVIPECTEKIYKIFKELKIPVKKEIGHQIDRGVQKHRLFLQKLVLIAEKYINKKTSKKIIRELEEVKKLAFGYARWMKVKKVSEIKNEGIKWVYDVTIEPQHTFISNGMILHNTITISKANIQATLRAETTVLAAANPKFGRFDPYEIIGKQIDLPSTLINRFDLIFPIKDMPSEEGDAKLAQFILELHQDVEIREKEGGLIDTDLIKKYVSYARQTCKPRLTDNALEEIKKYYVKMRNQGSNEGGIQAIPINARNLEALVRLTEAHAKATLQEKATKKNARAAIELLHFCLAQVGLDPETGKIDIDRITTGITASQRGGIHTIKEIINELELLLGKEIPIDDIIKQAVDKGIKEEKAQELIDGLKRAGDLFSPKHGFVSKI